MCPPDTTPDPRTLTHAPDTPEFVQPRRDVKGGDADARAPETPRPDEAEISRRPGLPEHPQQLAVDIEDEEADPVGSDQPGWAERFKSDSELQRD